MTKGIIAVGIILFILLMHTVFQMQLISLIIAPLVLAIWIGLLFKTPAWALVILITITELTSQTPPGAMIAIVLIPLALRPFLRTIPVGLTARFFTFVAAIIIGQVTLLYTTISYATGQLVFAWPASMFTIISSTIAAFLICIVWYEITTRRSFN